MMFSFLRSVRYRREFFFSCVKDLNGIILSFSIESKKHSPKDDGFLPSRIRSNIFLFLLMILTSDCKQLHIKGKLFHHTDESNKNKNPLKNLCLLTWKTRPNLTEEFLMRQNIVILTELIANLQSFWHRYLARWISIDLHRVIISAFFFSILFSDFAQKSVVVNLTGIHLFMKKNRALAFLSYEEKT